MKLRWTNLAVADLQEVYDFIAADDPGAAAATIQRIERAIRMLLKQPGAGRRGRVRGTRELVVPGTPFIVVYRLHVGAIELLAVIHGARQWPEAF